MRVPAALQRKLIPIKALILDCDGVLTDGRLYYGEQGVSLKAFDAKDGFGLVRLREAGVRVAIVSSDYAPLLERRAEKLGIADVQQNVRDKAETLRSFARQYLLDEAEVAYMGDDLNDLEAIKLAGASFAPADAVDAVRSAVDWVAGKAGGRGAVREAADLLLNARRA
ncbi:MAG: HAD-IIIA family hydrolase [Planctomycetes bacterium]|nr:HAD-IIIA family hydrolase [Planctomycetota bacterium]